jgi:cytoskeletal protein CcmA (bactofilin family)
VRLWARAFRYVLCQNAAAGGTMTNGQSIVIKGEISGGEDLVIAGRVEGKIRLEGYALTLAPGSQVTGEIAAGTVIISGAVNGSVVASKRLEARATAVIDGDISTPVLVVAEGAQVSAMVEMPARENRKPQLARAV